MGSAIEGIRMCESAESDLGETIYLDSEQGGRLQWKTTLNPHPLRIDKITVSDQKVFWHVDGMGRYESSR